MDKLDLALDGSVIGGNILEYKEGIRLKVVKSWKVATNSGRFIDTWLPRGPVLAPKDDNSQVDLSIPQWTPTLIRFDAPTPLPQGKRSHASAVLDDKPVLAKRLKQETPVIEKLRIATSNVTTSLSPDIAPTSKPKFTADPVSAAESATSITGGNSTVTSTRPTLASTEAHSKGMSSPDPIPLLDGSLSMTAGLNFGRTQYVALKKTSMMTLGKLINVIGIVKFVSEPSLTSHGQQLTCTLKIFDPSVSSLEDSVGKDSDALSVNCFTTKYKHWLPRPEVNDVIILRDVKISKFNYCSCAVGYHDKLQWAVYKKETGGIDHNRGDAPLYEGLGPNGLGVLFSPFHNAQPQEIDYCSKHSTWWRAIL
ncbi:hypothetical protein IW262DRAFT_1494127 [Armillaria fumosa]|nr:hypothetical protein IW262DRAFT_1494127 [Armillaria fumosa]